MLQHQQRVVQEKAELDERLARLNQFIASNPAFETLSDYEQQLMEEQADIMQYLSDILDARIQLWRKRRNVSC